MSDIPKGPGPEFDDWEHTHFPLRWEARMKATKGRGEGSFHRKDGDEPWWIMADGETLGLFTEGLGSWPIDMAHAEALRLAIALIQATPGPKLEPRAQYISMEFGPGVIPKRDDDKNRTIEFALALIRAAGASPPTVEPRYTALGLTREVRCDHCGAQGVGTSGVVHTEVCPIRAAGQK